MGIEFNGKQVRDQGEGIDLKVGEAELIQRQKGENSCSKGQKPNSGVLATVHHICWRLGRVKELTD